MKGFLKRQWPLIGLGALLILVSFYLIKSGKRVIREPFLSEIMSGEGLNLKEIHYTQDDPDKGLRWVLDAREVRFSGDKNAIFFHNFHLRLKPKNRPLITLKGKRGDYSRDSGEINLWGDLEGVSGDGYRIITEHMVINEKRRWLRTEKAVKIYGPFFSVEGRGLFADLENEQLKVLSDVTTVVHRESLS